MTDKEKSIVLTTDQLAERWGISPRTLETWRSETKNKKKKGPNYIKLGDGSRSVVLYRLSDIMEYEEENLREVD